MSNWHLSSSSDPCALAVVDGLGPFEKYGPHYSRRSPGSKTFTGVGQEVVLVHSSGAAVWAVVRQRTPSPRGTGASRGRTGMSHNANYVWRNMMFRRLPECPEVASQLIRSATLATYVHWISRYGSLPSERLRTEVDVKKVRSKNPGYCYQMAGWVKGPVRRDKLFLYAPSSGGA